MAPPKGMKCHIYEFDAQDGGAYRMSLTYMEPEHSTQGKTTENADVGGYVVLCSMDG